jgi:hypothetical protein
MKYFYRIVILVLLCSNAVLAQRDLTIHFLNKINQSNYSNPSFIPENNFSIGIPVLSGISGDFSNSGFQMKDMLQRGPDDSIHISDNLKNIVNNSLKEHNYLTADIATDLLAVKFKVKGLYFGVNVTERVNFHLDYPQDFAKLLFLGNAVFVDEKRDADVGVKINATHYREYGLSGALKIKHLTLGTRLKFLTGFADFSTQKSDVSIHTNPDDYSITTTADVLVNTTLPDTTVKVGKYLMNMGNKGFGMDIGGTLDLSSKLTVAASFVDLGFIKWSSSEVTNYQSAVNPTPYTGVPLSVFSSGSQAFADTLKKRFNVVKTHNSYTTTLTPKVYLSGTYKITGQDKVGVLIYSEYYNRTHTALTLAYNRDFGSWFTGGLTYTIFNNDYLNIGLGTGFKMGPVQIYSVQDNILGFFIPKSSNNINFRFGINLVFGKPDTKKSVPHPPPVDAGK